MTLEEQHTFEAIICQYRKSLIKIVATFEADSKLQQDLHQEILLAIWQALKSFKGQSSVHTYIYRVAYNKALSHVAKHSRTPLHQDLNDSYLCQRPSPENTTHSHNEVKDLMMAIRHLPMMHRQLITLSLDGVSYNDIAEITGLGLSNIGVQISRAKQAIKMILGEGNE